MEAKSAAKFISFEGIDGCGKSTMLALVSQWLDGAGITHIKTREPGGSPLGEAIRAILLDSSHTDMDSMTEVLLYGASRAQHVKEVIRPALDRGLWVLTDRYADATLAYQGYGRGLNLERLRRLHEWSTDDFWPDVTLLFDCDVETAARRRDKRADTPDRLELLDRAFHQKVRDGYLALAACEPKRFLTVDSGASLDEVTQTLRSLFQERLLHTCDSSRESCK